jgi:hypothetical protein
MSLTYRWLVFGLAPVPLLLSFSFSCLANKRDSSTVNVTLFLSSRLSLGSSATSSVPDDRRVGDDDDSDFLPAPFFRLLCSTRDAASFPLCPTPLLFSPSAVLLAARLAPVAAASLESAFSL